MFSVGLQPQTLSIVLFRVIRAQSQFGLLHGWWAFSLDLSMLLNFLLNFSSVLQALIEHLLCCCNWAPGGGDKEHSGLGKARTLTPQRLNVSPLLISCVALELLLKPSELGFPTYKMRLIIYQVFRIEKWPIASTQWTVVIFFFCCSLLFPLFLLPTVSLSLLLSLSPRSLLLSYGVRERPRLNTSKWHQQVEYAGM